MKKAIFIPILFFIIFLVALYFVVPGYSTVIRLQKQVMDKQIEVQEKQVYSVKLKEIVANLDEYQEFLDKIEKALPYDVSLPSLLNFFQDKALASGLIMENINPMDSAEEGATGVPESTEGTEENVNKKIKETVFRLSLSGSFSSFESFLELLEKSSRLVEVDSISFESGKTSEEDQETVFEFDLTAKVYSY
ncbi:MAG: type 4a pilus biogenesis protein PilO [Parcubacteria group bacterium]|nr:type 4a pilus biogenesis protein PilO [Parcubacteria group bacterium]